MTIRSRCAILCTILSITSSTAHPALNSKQIAQDVSTALTATGIGYLGYLRYIHSQSDAHHLAALACIFIGAAGMLASDAFGLQEPLSAPLAETNTKLAHILAQRKSKPVKMWPYKGKI